MKASIKFMLILTQQYSANMEVKCLLSPPLSEQGLILGHSAWSVSVGPALVKSFRKLHGAVLMWLRHKLSALYTPPPPHGISISGPCKCRDTDLYIIWGGLGRGLWTHLSAPHTSLPLGPGVLWIRDPIQAGSLLTQRRVAVKHVLHVVNCHVRCVDYSTGWIPRGCWCVEGVKWGGA